MANQFDKDFYPTPLEVAYKMLDFPGLLYHREMEVLEPSAGDGALLRALAVTINNEGRGYIEDKSDPSRFNIDVCEIDPIRQQTLKGMGVRLVHDDFLTYRTHKQYDLVLMNPPFSQGAKHLLHALKLVKRHGGHIACLLNAETLRNTFSNERKDLAAQLDELGADIEYMQHTFSNAERKTDVEIALVKVKLEAAPLVSNIFAGIEQATEKEEPNYNGMSRAWLAENDYLKAVVQSYETEIEAGILLLREAAATSAKIPMAFKPVDPQEARYYKGSPTLVLCLNDGYGKGSQATVNNYIQAIRSKYWEALFSNPQFVGNLTSNLRDEYHRKVKTLVNYEFSLFNIYTIKMELLQHLTRGVEETILQKFEDFTHKHSWYDETSNNRHYYDGWKTNKAYMVNKKVIVPLQAYSSWSGRLDLRYDVTRYLADVEKVLNYLDDGRTEARNLEARLDRAEQSGQTKNIELKYFNVTFYKKGTCHITFTAPDILKKFNIFGGQRKGWLPPTYGKQAYSDMEPEAQAVVDSFEGEKAYSETIKDASFYLFEGSQALALEQGNTPAA